MSIRSSEAKLSFLKKNAVSSSLFLAVILFIGMWQLSLFHNMMKWDIIDINLPWRYFISECLRNGELPLWNPYINSGFPQAADPMTWYPVSWFIGFLFGNDLLTIQYEYLGHILLGGIGMFLLGKELSFFKEIRLISGMAFMFSGLFISNAQHLGWIISGAWFPFAIYAYLNFCHKQSLVSGLVFIVILFFSLSGGYPAFFIVTVYILLAMFIYQLVQIFLHKKPLLRFILNHLWVLLIFTALSSVILFSSFEISGYLTRTEQLSPEYIQKNPLPVQGLLSFLFPYSTTTEVDFYGSDFSMVNCYFGVILLIFMLYALIKKHKRAMLFSIIGLFFLSVALADVFPFRAWLYHLPFMNVFRFPALFRFFAYVFFILAGAVGLDYYFSHKKKDKKLLNAICVIAFVIILCAAVSLFSVERWKFKSLLMFRFNEFDEIAAISERIVFQAMIQLSIILTLLLAFVKFESRRFKKALIFLVAFDMVLSVQMNINDTVIASVSPRLTQEVIAGLPEGFPIPGLNEKIADHTENSNPAIPRLWRNMNVYYKKPAGVGYTPYLFKSVALSENTGCYHSLLNHPLVFLADSINHHIVSESFIDTLSKEKIKILSFTPNRIELEVNTTRPQVLTFLQNNYPGWKALLNQKSVEILTTNKTFMSIRIGEGNSVVRFEYAPSKVKAFFYLSSATFILILSVLLFFGIQKIQTAYTATH